MSDVELSLRGLAKGISYGNPIFAMRAAGALTQAADEIRRLREALKPFAVYYEINNCQDRAADDTLDIPIGDLCKAREVYGALLSTQSDRQREGE